MISAEKDLIIINKIKKLLALSHSPNENEAMVAAQKANELLIKHNLSLGDICGKDVIFSKEIIYTYKRACSWKNQLIAGVAYLNFCIAYEVRLNNGLGAAIFYGREANVITGKLQWDYLVDVIEGLVVKSRFTGLSAKNAFRTGCAVRIANRMQDILKAQQKSGICFEGDSTSALVVQSLHRKMEDEKQQLMEELGDVPSKKPGKYSDRYAFSEGLLAGDSVGLSKQLVGV